MGRFTERNYFERRDWMLHTKDTKSERERGGQERKEHIQQNQLKIMIEALAHSLWAGLYLHSLEMHLIECRTRPGLIAINQQIHHIKATRSQLWDGREMNKKKTKHRTKQNKCNTTKWTCYRPSESVIRSFLAHVTTTNFGFFLVWKHMFKSHQGFNQKNEKKSRKKRVYSKGE